MKMRRLHKSVALLAVAGIAVAACGGDDDTGGDTGGDTAEQTAATGGTESGETSVATETADTGDTSASETTSGAEATGDIDTTVSAGDEIEPVYGGSIAVGLEAEATGLRPWDDTCSAPCYNIMATIYDKLVEQDAEGNYQGWLAESVTPNDDFTVWTLTLRPGVAFHNGVELTAQTIVDMFAIQQTGSQSSGSIATAGLAAVEATGDLEVTYTLNRSNSAFPAYLARAPIGMVFEPAAAAADSAGYSLAPIGTGPFVIESRDLDNATVVVRNENYWGVSPSGDQLPYLDSITFRPIPDEGTRLDALLSGTVQVMESLRQGTIRDTRAAKDGGADLTLLEFQGNNMGGGMFNVMVPPFDDLRVRRGLTLMNPQEQVIEALGGTGISLPATQWFSPDSPWYSEAAAAAWPMFDYEAGVAALQEYIDDPARSDGKGAGEPIDVTLSCPPDPTLIAAMQVLEGTWGASGLVNVSLTNFDQQTHINNALGADNAFVGHHQAHCWRWSSNSDPSVDITPFLGPPTQEIADEIGAPAPSALNFPNWWSPESYDLAQQATKTDDFDERKALYEQIMINIAEELPIWYSGHTATILATDASVHGINGWHLPSGDLGVGFPESEGRYVEAFVAG